MDRPELAQLKSLDFSGVVSKTTSMSIIRVNTKRLAVRLPKPKPNDLELISLLISVELENIAQKPDIYLNEPENYYSDVAMAEIDEKPKRRSLFAQFFRSNIKQVSEDLGIDNSSKKKPNSDSWFVVKLIPPDSNNYFIIPVTKSSTLPSYFKTLQTINYDENKKMDIDYNRNGFLIAFVRTSNWKRRNS